MSRIKVIEQEAAEGELAEVYRGITGSRGKLAEVHKIQSLHPASIAAHMDLYKTVMFSASPLSRAEREMMAVVVSAENDCLYCIEHHAQALNHFWKDRSRVDLLARRGSDLPGLSNRERLLCEFSVAATAAPAGPEVEGIQKKLRSAGVDDRGLLDASLVVSYFNFVNRMVLTLGVSLEDDPGGYEYE